jgi:predicted GNAT family acetyltransferase
MQKRSGRTAVSAVCIDPAIRRQGLAARPVPAVAPDVRARDERSFLHTSARNTNTRRLYESLGFRL